MDKLRNRKRISCFLCCSDEVCKLYLCIVFLLWRIHSLVSNRRRQGNSPPSARRLGQTSGQWHLQVTWALACIYVHTHVRVFRSLHTHRHTHTTVVAEKEWQLPKRQSGVYCQLLVSQLQGVIELHLWLFSTGENSSRSFTWQRVAFVKELLVLSDFSVTVSLGRLKFLVPHFLCYLYDYDKEHPNIPVWSYVIYIHSIFCFWYISVCCVATFNINASDEYFCYIYLHIFWERVSCPKGHKCDEIILSKRETVVIYKSTI